MNRILQLDLLDLGQSARIVLLKDDLNPKTAQRLQDLGFNLGASLVLERRLPFGGPIVVRVGGGVVALEQSATQSILVETKVSHDKPQ